MLSFFGNFKVIKFFYYPYRLIPEKSRFTSHNSYLYAHNCQPMVQQQGSTFRSMLGCVRHIYMTQMRSLEREKREWGKSLFIAGHFCVCKAEWGLPWWLPPRTLEWLLCIRRGTDWGLWGESRRETTGVRMAKLWSGETKAMRENKTINSMRVETPCPFLLFVL